MKCLFIIVVCVNVIGFFLCDCSGESYAGIYVPTLVHTIMNMNPQQTSDKQINLKGFTVSLTELETTSPSLSNFPSVCFVLGVVCWLTSCSWQIHEFHLKPILSLEGDEFAVIELLYK